MVVMVLLLRKGQLYGNVAKAFLRKGADSRYDAVLAFLKVCGFPLQQIPTYIRVFTRAHPARCSLPKSKRTRVAACAGLHIRICQTIIHFGEQ